MYQLTDIQENIELIASAKNYGFEEKISQTCAGEDNKPKVYFASANPDLNSLFFVPPDSGKEELIPALNSIPKDSSAFYIHCENGEVKDFTIVKGTLKIEDSVQLKNKIVSEGTTINTWDNGSKITDMIVFSQ